MERNEHLLFSGIATLIGTVIGAGFLGIPSAFTLSGFVPGVIMIFLVALATMFMCFFASELALNTTRKVQMPGLIGMYMGKNFKKLALVIISLMSFGAMIAYLVACSDILFSYTGINPRMFIVLIFLFVSYFVWSGLKFVEKAELFINASLVIFLLLLILLIGGGFNTENLLTIPTTNLLVPFGVIIFAFGGYNVMPEIEKIVKGKKDLMIQTCIIGTFIPLMFYLTFTVLMIGVFGSSVAEVATESLSGIIGIVGNSIGFLAMLSSFLISGLILRDVFTEDFNIDKRTAVAVVMLVPFLIAFFLQPGFINVLAYTGAVLAGLFAFLVCTTVVFQRARIRKPKFVSPGGRITVILVGLFFLMGSLILFF